MIHRAWPSGACRRAFTIIHMVGAVAILGVFSLVTAQLFSSSMKVAADVAHGAQRHVSAGAMMRMMRDDVWSAQLIEALPAAAALTQPDGRIITWSIDEPGELLRTVTLAGDDEPRGVTRWSIPGGRLRFHQQGPSLVLRDEARRLTHEAAFVSQLLLAREMAKAGEASP